MIFSTVVLICILQQVFGQFENGIIFKDDGKSTPNSVLTRMYLANKIIDFRKILSNVNKQEKFTEVPVLNTKCNCVPKDKCSIPVYNIDIRIVNNGAGNDCPPGFEQCCENEPSSTTPTLINSSCGIRKIKPTPQPVIGQASFGAYPWQAALLNIDEAYIGSGVLLSSTHVLTVAHKVKNFVNYPTSLLVRLGEWNAFATTEPYQYIQLTVEKVIIHPNFNPMKLENDVAVIKLMGVVPIASYPNINTACKPTSVISTGTKCYVSGWGKNMFGPTGTYQSIMREVDVPIVDITECQNRLRQTKLGPTYTLNNMSFLCAGGEIGKDACEGDGGSPLVCQNPNGQWSVNGLVSWGIGCADYSIPGVYTNVFNFIPWINSTIAKM